jgi:hypothetical protein
MQLSVTVQVSTPRGSGGLCGETATRYRGGY